MQLNDINEILKKLQHTQVPRSVRFRLLSLLNYNVFIISLILFLLFNGFSPYIHRTWAYFFGIKASAIVVDSKMWETKGKNGIDTNHGLTLSFPFPGNKYIEFEEISGRYYERLKKGDIISIHYTDESHEYPFLDDDDINNLYVGFIPFTVLVIVLLIYAWFLKQSYNLLRLGMPVIGTVLDVEVSNGRNGKTYFWRTEYFLNKKELIRNFKGKKENPGQVLILLDPDKPERAQIYEEKFSWKLFDYNRK